MEDDAIMRYFVKATAFDTVVRDDDIARTRHAFGAKVRQIKESGKMVEGGVLADGRGGVFIFDVDSHQELMGLLAPQLVDHFNVECHPLVSFEDLMDLFKRQGAGQSGG